MEDEEYAIDVKGLTKYFQQVTAVDHIDLRVKKGDIFGFLGPNGSGKTTTIRMLCGLLTPDAGSGQCLGFDILTESDAIKNQVGYMSQRFALYDELSIEENLRFIADIYGLANPGKRVAEMMEFSGLSKQEHALAGQLSGGWRQRLSLAAALMHDPKLLLLDEPTAGVDPKARLEFWEHIHKLALTGITTIVSTHYMDEAERCNYLAYILHGHIIVQGTAEEIVAKSKLLTWEVRGRRLALLAGHLRQEPGVEQVISYGHALHVSSRDAAILNEMAEKYAKGYHWQATLTTLDDVFVNMVGLET
jgi:ABC-2 type transport system ATP-binding protein